MDELNDMIQKVHDHNEGRYELTTEDLFEIHNLLCVYNNLINKMYYGV